MLLYICCFLENDFISQFSPQKGDFLDLTKNIYNANKSLIVKNDLNSANFISIPYDLNNYYISFYNKDSITLATIRNSLMEYNENLEIIAPLNKSSSSINENKYIRKSKNEDDQKILLFLESVCNNISIIYNENNVANPKFTINIDTDNRILEILKNYFEDFNDAYKTLGVDKISLVQRELELIKIEKLEILNQLIDRELDLESLLDKSESLKSTSHNFKIKSKKELNSTQSRKTFLRLFSFLWILIGLIVILLNYDQFVTGTKNFINSFHQNDSINFQKGNLKVNEKKTNIKEDNFKVIKPIKSKINSLNIN